MTTEGRVIHDALVHHGFTMDGATKIMERFVDEVIAENDRSARQAADPDTDGTTD